jgi:BirA family biotin operon repressor/biotin-[acetyl-CoA-carboxylase] ligase
LYNIPPNTLFVGRNIVYLPSCHSTNDIAASLSRDSNVTEGTTVVTHNQTAGRGQRGNSWEAEPGKNLTLSVILKPSFLHASEHFQLNMAVSTACHQFLTQHFPEDIHIKWPNDLYFGHKKLGGILIESVIKNNRLEEVVVGIGINVNQEQYSESKAISMKLISRVEYSLEKLLPQLLTSLEQHYLKLKARDLPYIQNYYLKNLYFYQKKRTFKANRIFDGTIIGIDPIGRLQIETDGQVHSFSFKEIEFI